LTKKVIEQDHEVRQHREESDMLKQEIMRLQDNGMKLSEGQSRYEEEVLKLRQELSRIHEDHTKEMQALTPR
jgi:hypothetical protein